MISRLTLVGAIVLAMSASASAQVVVEKRANEKSSSPTSATSAKLRRSALSKLNGLIGQWRGVGRPKRYRAEGAWQEKADWLWAFEKNGPSLRYQVQDGKHFKDAELSWDIEKKNYVLALTTTAAQKQLFHGRLDKNKLVLVRPDATTADVHRLRLTMLNPKRTLLLLEKQTAGRGPFSRVYEVGYTRAGTRLAKDALGGPECVVTGGLGTIEVSHEGKTYVVCCTGCRDVFNEDPEATLKAYRKRLAEEKALEAERLEAEKRVLESSKPSSESKQDETP